jgi:hypothetical protein
MQKGGLIISSHNEICDEICDLATWALISSSVHDEPKTHLSCSKEAMEATEAKPAVSQNLQKSQSEEHRDILTNGLWAHAMDCIIDIHVMDTDCKF